MDKNSLLAFLLIAVIIFLMPEYYKLVYPPVHDADSLIVDSEKKIKDTPLPDLNIIIPPSSNKPEDIARSFSVRTNLYTAEISALNGGSIASFVIHNYALNDSESVELINNNNVNNLMVDFRSIDGDDISLSAGWVADNDYDINIYEMETTVTFHKEVDDKRISKSLTFYPNKYIIDISIDLSEIQRWVSLGSSTVSWPGGLPLTEPNKKDENIYYQAMVFQGDETYTPKPLKPSQAKLERMDYPTDWIAVRTKYFITALVPQKQAPGSQVLAIQENEDIRYDVGLYFDVGRPFLSTLYIGPLEYSRIKQLGKNVDRIMNFGWAFIRPISKIVHWFLIFLYTVSYTHLTLPTILLV